MSFWAPFFSNQSMLGDSFAHFFREFVKVFRGFARILKDFSRILKDFSRIFTKSKILGVRLHPCTRVSYTSGLKILNKLI